MRFLGLPLPWLIAILAVPSAVAIFLYGVNWQNKREIVAYVALWRRVAETTIQRRGLRRVEAFASLCLQLLFIALLAFAIGRVRLNLQSRGGRAIVFVLDTSASMQALEGRRERFQQAVARLRRDLANLSDFDEAALVTTCPPEVVAPFSSSRSAIHQALDRLAALDGSGDMATAIANAQAMLRAQRDVHPEISIGVQVITDGSETIPESKDVPLAVDIVGSSVENLGITVFGARTDPLNPTSSRILVEVGNFGTRAAQAELRISVDDHLLDVIPVKLLAGERIQKQISQVSETSHGRMTARLEKIIIDGGGTDALPADNVAYALMPRRGEQRVRVDASGNQFLLKALNANPRYLVERVELRSLETASQGDVVTVLVGAIPERVPPGNYVIFNPRGGDLPFHVARELQHPTITNWHAEHPVLRSVSLSDVALARSTQVVLSTGAAAIASYLDEPVIWTVDDGRRRAVVMGFDLIDSNLPLRASFPVLLYNAIAWVSSEWTARPLALKAGQTMRWPTTAAFVLGPKGRVPASRDGDSLRFFVGKAGFYYLENAAVPTFASSVLDPRESAVASNQRSTSFKTIVAPRMLDHELWGPLLWLAIALSCFEWWSYHRRVTT